MADIVIRGEQLAQLTAGMRRIGRQFGEVDGIGSALPEAVGHDRLRGRLHDFGSSWDERREEIVHNLDALAQAVFAISQTFDEVDLILSEGVPEGGS